jgi:hypothetical protein
MLNPLTLRKRLSPDAVSSAVGRTRLECCRRNGVAPRSETFRS